MWMRACLVEHSSRWCTWQLTPMFNNFTVVKIFWKNNTHLLSYAIEIWSDFLGTKLLNFMQKYFQRATTTITSTGLKLAMPTRCTMQNENHAVFFCFRVNVLQLTGTVALVGYIVGTIDVPVALLVQRYTLSVVALPGISGTCFFRCYKVSHD